MSDSIMKSWFILKPNYALFIFIYMLIYIYSIYVKYRVIQKGWDFSDTWLSAAVIHYIQCKLKFLLDLLKSLKWSGFKDIES